MPQFERIGLCIIAILLVLIVLVWAYTPPTPPPRQPTPLPELPRSRASKYYDIQAHDGLDLAPIAHVADTAHDDTRAWLGVPAAPDVVDSKLPIYLCNSLGAMRQATRHVFFPGAPADTLLGPALGRYLGAKRGIVAVGVEPRIRQTVAHEVTHHVLGLFLPQCPATLNEGAAVYLARRHASPIEIRSLRRTRTRHVRELGALELSSLIELSYDDFHGAHQHAHYTLAYLLVRLLAECDDPAIAGRLPRLYAAIDRDSSPWECFCRIYDGKLVTQLWQEAIQSFLQQSEKRSVKPR